MINDHEIILEGLARLSGHLVEWRNYILSKGPDNIDYWLLNQVDLKLANIKRISGDAVTVLASFESYR